MFNVGSVTGIQFRGGVFHNVITDIDTRDSESVRCGIAAGGQSVGQCNVFLGCYTGQYASPTAAVFIGGYAGGQSTADESVVVGTADGPYSTGSRTVILGAYAGASNASADSVFVGAYAGAQETLTGPGHVVIGAGAGSNATGAGWADTVVGFLAGSDSVATLGSNVVLGACAGQHSYACRSSVVVGWGAADASSLSNSVVIGAGAACNLAGDQNVFVGCGSAPSLRLGSSNVFVGQVDASQSNVSRSVAIGSVHVANDSVVVGHAIDSTRSGAIVLGSNIALQSENSVMLGGNINCRSAQLFQDSLTATTSNDTAQTAQLKLGMSNVIYVVQSADHSMMTLGYGWSNVTTSNTSAAYKNSVFPTTPLITLLKVPYTLERGTVCVIDTDAKNMSGLAIAAALGDLVSSAFPGKTTGSGSGFAATWSTAVDVSGQLSVSPFNVDSVSATFSLGQSTSNNFTGMGSTVATWKVDLPKRIHAPRFSGACNVTTISSLMPFSLNNNIYASQIYDTLIGNTGAFLNVTYDPSGITMLSPLATAYVRSAPLFGQIYISNLISAFDGTIPQVLDTGTPPSYNFQQSFGTLAYDTRHSYSLPMFGTDQFSVCAMQLVSPGGYGVPSVEDYTIRFAYSPAFYGPTTVPLIAGRLTQLPEVAYMQPMPSLTLAIPSLPSSLTSVGFTSDTSTANVRSLGWSMGQVAPGEAYMTSFVYSSGNNTRNVTLRPYALMSALAPPIVRAFSIEFHHAGSASSNVVDPRFSTVLSELGWTNRLAEVKLLVVQPPTRGFLGVFADAVNSVGMNTVCEVMYSQVVDSSLKYISMTDGGPNDQCTVCIGLVPSDGLSAAMATAATYTLNLKHYVYTTARCVFASNLPPYAHTRQLSAGYLADGVTEIVTDAVAFAPAPVWFSRATFLSTPPSSFALAVDRASQASLAPLASGFQLDVTQVADLRFVVVKHPAWGMVGAFDQANVVFTPLTTFMWSDAQSGRIVYQHDGSSSNVDSFQVCVATHPYDVRPDVLYPVSVTVLDLPVVTANGVEVEYYTEPLTPSSNFHLLPACLRTSTGSSTFFVTSSSNVLVPSIIPEGSPNVAVTFQTTQMSDAWFRFSVANGSTSNALARLPQYQSILTAPHRFEANHINDVHVIAVTSTRMNRVLYQYAANANNQLANTIVTLSFSFQPLWPLAPVSPLAQAVLAPYQKFELDVVLWDASGNNLVALQLTEAGVICNNQRVGVGSPVLNAWNAFSITLTDGQRDVTVGLSDATSNVTSASALDLSRLRTIGMQFDMTSTSNVVQNVVSAGVIPLSLMNEVPSVNIQLFSMAVVNALTVGSTSSNDNYNIVMGRSIDVLGVNNIAIGSHFLSSGNGSLIIGNNIATQMYDSIVLGNSMFSGHTVKNVIAIGRNIMNDLGTDLSSYMILIGNDISAASWGSYTVNLGNSFLRGDDGRIYLGAAGEQVCVNLSHAVVAASSSVSALDVGGSAHVRGDMNCVGEVVSGYSDRRLKGGVRPLDGALERVGRLAAFTYEPNQLALSLGFAPRRAVGLCAQDVAAVLPEAVRLAPFDCAGSDEVSRSGHNYLAVQYERVVPLLVAALQEEVRLRERLEARVQALEDGL